MSRTASSPSLLTLPPTPTTCPTGRTGTGLLMLRDHGVVRPRVPDEVKGLVTVDDTAAQVTVHDLDIIVVHEPTELIAFDGVPQWQPLVGTDLLYATNSESDVFKVVSDSRTYVLISGRWYSSSSLSGPWAFVEPSALPSVFRDIPVDSKKASVRSSVAGTLEAEDAVLDAYIPTTAAVDRSSASITVKYDGDPYFTKISGTQMEYAVNTSTPVIRVQGLYYAVDDGVWYVAPSATGPWAVSDKRPDEVDKIPSSSPVSNVKYVYVYSATPTVVYVGYTPGYYGTFVYGPTVVYGTGWYYNPWWGPHFYPRPYTWGFHVRYSSFHGWSYGFSYSRGWVHVGVRFGPRYYPPMRHPGFYRPPVYRRPAYRPPAYRPPSYRPPGGTRPPSNRPGTRPTGRPSTSPATRPSTRPTTRQGYQPSTRPSTYSRPGTSNRVPRSSVQHPTSRPSNRSAFQPSTRTRSAPRSMPRGGGGRRR